MAQQRLAKLSPPQREFIWSQLKDSDPLTSCAKEFCRSSFHPEHHPGAGYIPTERQLELLNEDRLNMLIYGGHRASKSSTSAVKATELTEAFIYRYREQACGQVAWIVGNTYDKTVAEFNGPDWSLAENFKRLRPGVTVSKPINPGTIEIPVTWVANGKPVVGPRPFTIKTKSADDPDSINMEAPIWIIAAEAAQFSQDVFFRLTSRISEARARFPGFGLLLLEGTATSSLGWYPALWSHWQSPAAQAIENAVSKSLASETNTWLYPLGDKDPEILSLKRMLPEDLYLERHMGVPAPPKGRVHEVFDVLRHVRNLEFNPEWPLYIGIDPGYSGQPSRYAVVFIQKNPSEERACGLYPGQWGMIDEIYVEKKSTAEVCQMAMNKPCWKTSSKHAVIDVMGRKVTEVSPESNETIWRAETGLSLYHQPVDIMGGINRLNTMLKPDPVTGEPGFVVDVKCRGFIAENGGGLDPISHQAHVYSWSEDSDRNAIGKVPADRHNDSTKATTYLFVNVLGWADKSYADKRKPRAVRRHRAELVYA